MMTDPNEHIRYGKYVCIGARWWLQVYVNGALAGTCRENMSRFIARCECGQQQTFDREDVMVGWLAARHGEHAANPTKGRLFEGLEGESYG